jgi:uncharacterized membrane protein
MHSPKPAGVRWSLPIALLLLVAIPLGQGAVRVATLAAAVPITADNARFFASPAVVVLHVLGVTAFCVLGAFQVTPGLRRRNPRWHRAAGRLLVGCGLLVGLSGLWMTLFSELPSSDGDLLGAFRVVFGTAMIASIVLGLRAVLSKDIPRHRAWMTRGYALGLGAGTQVLTLAAGELIAGPPSELSRALLMGAAWVINLAVAEWMIRRRPAAPVRTAPAAVAHLS